jgi:hypothetical protein
MSMTDSAALRHKTVQALSWNLLEADVRKWETEGWRREGDVALAKGVSESTPPYWVQTMSHDPFPIAGASPGQPAP